MKEIFKNAKKNSLYGMRFRRLLKMKSFAVVMLLLVGTLYAVSAFNSDNTVSQVGGAAMGMTIAAPLLFAVPKELGLSENEEKGLEALAKHLNDQFDQHQKGLLDSEELNNKVKSAFEGFVKDYGIDKETLGKMQEVMKAQGLEIKALKGNSPGKKESLKEALESNLTKDKIEQLKSNKGAQIEFELKEATTIMTTNATNAPHALRYEVVPGIQEVPYRPALLFMTLSKGGTNSRTIIWINRVDKDGAAAFIAEGALKPLMDWEYEEETSTAKKIAVSTKVSTEMLEDFEYMEGEIMLLLRRSIFDELNNKILNGDGTGANPLGIANVASTYVGTALDGTVLLPNDADAIRAGILQLDDMGYIADVAYVNPATAASLDLTKTTDGHYLRIEMDNILRLVRIIETREIPAGKILLMDTARWIIKTYKASRIEFGWENDDFRRNLVTVIAEMRIHSYANSIDAGAFLFDTFANIKGAIESV